MKLVREHINEKFTDESDPIQDMAIGQRAIIKKWFDSAGVKPNKYVIDNKYNISVGGSLDLRGTAITELPDNLKVGGYLDLQGTAITELPDNLKVGGYLDLRGTAITELPDNLSVRGSLILYGTSITELPKSLKVKGNIFKDF